MRHIQFVSFATVAALLGTFACGSDSSGGGGAGTGSGGTSSGGSAGSGTGGATGGTAGAGTGGAATGGVAGSGTGGTATGGTAGAATGGTGGGATGACTNGPDQTIINDPNSMIQEKVGNCGQSNFGAEPGTTDCIKQQTGLSDPCVACFDATIHCAIEHCVGQCLIDSNSAECIACRAQFCDGPFEQCSGLTVD